MAPRAQTAEKVWPLLLGESERPSLSPLTPSPSAQQVESRWNFPLEWGLRQEPLAMWYPIQSSKMCLV